MPLFLVKIYQMMGVIKQLIGVPKHFRKASEIKSLLVPKSSWSYSYLITLLDYLQL